VRAYRGTNVESDTNLLIIKFSLKLRRIKKKVSNLESQNISKKPQKQMIRREFVIELSNKFEALSF